MVFTDTSVNTGGSGKVQCSEYYIMVGYTVAAVDSPTYIG